MSAFSVTPDEVAYYRSHGFVRIRGIISPEEAAAARAAADEVLRNRSGDRQTGKVFRQFVNTWRTNEVLRSVTLHRNIGAAATQLSGKPMRLWHDHLLVKEPHNQAPTHFHQDQPYWPHGHSTEPISCWVALNDVPVERGCMTFITGSRRLDHLTVQNLNDAGSLFSLAPDLAFDERVTFPLRAGDCTFHHGRTAHMANANATDENRYGFAIIFMDQSTTYTGTMHVVTDPLKEAGSLKEGDVLSGELFPEV